MLIWFLLWFYVFFFKQKTAYELRISDWSSDVCSSDLMLWFGGANMYQSLTGILRSGLWFDLRVASDTNVMLAVAVNSAYQALLALLPLFVLLVVVAILASVLLGGFLFSTKSLEPKFERMNPLKGVARMFSAQTMVELIKTLAKASVIGTVAALVISHYRDQMISLMHTTPTEALTSGIGLVALCCALIVAALFLIVALYRSEERR